MGTTNQIEVLNDIIQINNDRIKGYNTAIKNLEEGTELNQVFAGMVEQSQHFNHDLREEVKRLGGDPETTSTAAGNIYRAWMDVKATFGGTDRASILSSCEFGEDAAKNAYKTAVDNSNLNSSQLEVLRKQQSIQLAAHDKIKALRNQTS